MKVPANMTDKSVLILCAGVQSRWGNIKIPKQLLHAGEETLLDRIVRQVRDRGAEPVIVTHLEELQRPGVRCVCPKNRRWKAESLLDLKDSWGSYVTLVLLGDVIYQGHVMNRIFDHDGIDMFFGNYAEIFAYYFHNNVTVKGYLNDVIQRCLNSPDKGTLHSLFRAYIGEFTRPSIERHKDRSNVFTHVTGDGGWTRDIDTPEEYELFLKEVVKTNKLDDLPRRPI